MKKGIIVALILFVGATVFGQDDWLTYPGTSAPTERPTHVQLNYGVKKGKVTLHQDSRIEKLGEFVRSGESTLDGVKIDGYRIVIFFDQDKTEVSKQKAIFLTRFGGHKTYVDYVAPNYRLRVGNFRTKLEAEGLKAEFLPYFPTAVVVEDKIQLPELPEN